MKDYKKILEGVVDIINATEKSDIGFVNICTYIGENCPELAESDDERIRKRLINYFHGFLDGYEDTYKVGGCVKWEGLDVKDVIAWLEKKGEQKQELLTKEKALKNSPFVEQKPAEWIQELESKLSNATPEQLAEWKEKYFKVEPAWSEEDEVKINRIVACLENLNVADNDTLLKDVDWLKNRLKSLRPQKQWKPTENHLKGLRRGIKDTEEGSDAWYDLKDLYEQLKEL